jgi:hypothetical protein
MNQEIVITERKDEYQVVNVNDLKKRSYLVTEIKKEVMKENLHYGLVPGCGKKPTLFKNGAELLCMSFGLSPESNIQINELGEGHREYIVTTTLRNQNGFVVASSAGSCCTKESKYRYRGNELIATGNPVPKNYWVEKNNAILGIGCVAKKDENGNWMIFKKGENKKENEDIADVYNTVLKMAVKRSLVASVLLATGGSCEFTQDIEDNIQDIKDHTQNNDVQINNTQINEVQYNDNEININEKTVNRRQGFLYSMKKLSAIDNVSFVNLLGAAGYERAEDVPEESYGKVYKQMKEAMDKVKDNF